MPRRFVVGGCSNNTHKDEVTTHLWPRNEKLALKWDRFVQLKQANWSKVTAGRLLYAVLILPRRTSMAIISGRQYLE